MIASSNRPWQPGWLLLAGLTIFTGHAIAAQTGPGTLNTIFNFPGSNGQPLTGVVIGAGGVLYGTAYWPHGTIYSLTPPASGRGWTYTVLYTFPDAMRNQAGYSVNPTGLTIGSDGVLYGTNAYGGNMSGTCSNIIIGCGSVFSLTPPSFPGAPWTETDLYDFTGGADGATPYAGVLVGPGGVLYGTNQTRAAGVGTVFSLTPPALPGGSWTLATLHTFTGGADGSAPAGNLVIDSNGVLYGTTNFGGGNNYGTVFSVSPPTSPGGAWIETVIYRFKGGADGSVPNGGVVLGAGGVLYGSVKYGGSVNGGAVYALTPPAIPGGAWTETVLHNFPLIDTWGPFPGPLTWGPNGSLYGMTGLGGPARAGSVFALTPPTSPGSGWNYLALYGFAPPGGTYPLVSFYEGGETLAVAAGGLIYGTTTFGGPSNMGIVFALRP